MAHVPTLPESVSRDFLAHHRLCPVDILPDGAVAVAVSPESLVGGLDDLSVAYERPVVAQPRSTQDVDLLIARLTSADEAPVELGTTGPEEGAFTADLQDLANQAPVVRYVNLLIREAHHAGASDIHLESTRAGLRARFRIDGVLVPGVDPLAGQERAVVSRVKLLANLDVAERRRPQDGRIGVRLDGRDLDLRVSTVPTVFGESVVLRLLDRGGGTIALDTLGMPDALLSSVRRLAERSRGLILVTGPTGSGKTTTLYAALSLRSAQAEKIVTLEDPVEYAIEGVAQVPVHAQTGVTFASMLRSILRQDPDVMLVGEMRDAETAELAVRAALTGHLVFSTLHTGDALGAVPRMLDLGVPPYLVSATLAGVIAQRLVRRVCDDCREPYAPAAETVALLVEEPEPLGEFTRGRGCPSCRGTGFRGRTGVFELLVGNPEMRAALAAGSSRARLEQLARAHGMRPLRADGWAKVQAGVTTVEEVVRATSE